MHLRNQLLLSVMRMTQEEMMVDLQHTYFVEKVNEKQPQMQFLHYYTDNGTVDIANVVIDITYSTHHIETLSSGTAIVGGKLISKSFSYDDLKSIFYLVN